MSHPFCQVATAFPPYLGLDGKPRRHEIDLNDDLTLPDHPIVIERRVHAPKGRSKFRLFLSGLIIGAATLMACAHIAGLQVQKEAEESTLQVKEALAALSLPYPKLGDKNLPS